MDEEAEMKAPDEKLRRLAEAVDAAFAAVTERAMEAHTDATVADMEALKEQHAKLVNQLHVSAAEDKQYQDGMTLVSVGMSLIARSFVEKLGYGDEQAIKAALGIPTGLVAASVYDIMSSGADLRISGALHDAEERGELAPSNEQIIFDMYQHDRGATGAGTVQGEEIETPFVIPATADVTPYDDDEDQRSRDRG